jgi:hypothetical protein
MRLLLLLLLALHTSSFTPLLPLHTTPFANHGPLSVAREREADRLNMPVR